jgi:N utilization substance protein B
MASRHLSRRRALQILYQWDMRKQPIEDSLRAYYTTLYSEETPEKPEPDAFMEELVRGTVDRIKSLDELITKHSAHWRLERMPLVDRNILRLAMYDMLHVGTPAAVAIDEALELARRFSGDESVSFVNGVLDALRKEAKA